MNPDWLKAIFSSVIKHFKTLNTINWHIEGEEKKETPQVAELRLNGPYVEQYSKSEWCLKYELNILTKTIKDNNLYSHVNLNGLIAQKVTDISINLDNTYIGCFSRVDDIEIIDLGEDQKVQQSLIYTKYQILLEGN